MTIDISSLYRELGYFTYDPGFMATASCWSNITYLDGGKGILEYRGYPIEQLAEEGTFIETCYLLLNGELPNNSELAVFEKSIKNHSMLHEQLKRSIAASVEMHIQMADYGRRSWCFIRVLS